MEKKRDSRGRILRDGERQRTDGRYEYRYRDIHGNQQSAYSWRLVATDPTPAGKRACRPLRELEAEIAEQTIQGLDAYRASILTLDGAFEWYVSLRPRWKPTTRSNHIALYNRYVKPTLGTMKVADVRQSHLKKLYIDLQKEIGLGFGSVTTIHGVLHPIFEQLVEDDIIRKNPSNRALRGTEINPAGKRHALTAADQARLLEFIKRRIDQWYWRPLVVFMLGTGARIGETCALRWKHIDFEHNLVSIEENLIGYYDEDGIFITEISTPKTANSIRKIPLFDDVKEILLSKYNAEVFRQHDRNIGEQFVFPTRRGTMLTQSYAGNIMTFIQKAFNEEERANAEKEGRQPVEIPKFSPHTLRHTYCTRLCEQGVNIKVIQTVMGHADIHTTMDIYAEATGDFVLETFKGLESTVKAM